MCCDPVDPVCDFGHRVVGDQAVEDAAVPVGQLAQACSDDLDDGLVPGIPVRIDRKTVGGFLHSGRH